MCWTDIYPVKPFWVPCPTLLGFESIYGVSIQEGSADIRRTCLRFFEQVWRTWQNSFKNGISRAGLPSCLLTTKFFRVPTWVWSLNIRRSYFSFTWKPRELGVLGALASARKHQCNVNHYHKDKSSQGKAITGINHHRDYPSQGLSITASAVFFCG